MTRSYFDHNATTPVAPEVLEAMLPLLRDDFGNASSIHHYGQRAKQELETARERLAALMHAQPRDLVFLSGGTEADNLALFGVVRNSGRPRRHVITTAVEHPAVLGACAQLEREGVEVTRLPVSSAGLVDPDDVRRALRPDTVMVSVMHANNELGTVQPIAEIARIAREAGAAFHSDGVQALGKIPVDVEALGVDLYSSPGTRSTRPRARARCGFAKDVPLELHTIRRASRTRPPRPARRTFRARWRSAAPPCGSARTSSEEAARVRALRDRLESGILARVPECGVNGGARPAHAEHLQHLLRWHSRRGAW